MKPKEITVCVCVCVRERERERERERKKERKKERKNDRPSPDRVVGSIAAHIINVIYCALGLASSKQKPNAKAAERNRTDPRSGERG